MSNFLSDAMAPVMTDVVIDFESGKVAGATMQKFDKIRMGEEIVVSGKFSPDSGEVKTMVSGHSWLLNAQLLKNSFCCEQCL